MDYVAFQPETSEHMASDADLGLDPSDPLNLLLHNSFGSSDSSMDEVDGSGPQWSQLSSLFPLDHDAFKTSDMLDFGLGMNTIDPHALHNQKVNYDYSSYYPPSDMDHFPFTFQTPESTASNVNSAQDFSDDPAAEIAQRVRQSAGVMQAVPIVHQSLMVDTKLVHSRASTAATSPISFTASTPPSSSSAASTPPPSTPPSSMSALSGMGSLPVQFHDPGNTPVTFLTRPKTSHTNIERKYRTNLNARIQNLRMAVPALRVLENQGEIGTTPNGGRKVKVKLPVGQIKVKREGEDFGEDEVIDIVDERGFVDGVKVARKCSKANVLGKAAEYIHVLKRREQRLKNEQAGLKVLISGLVGGPSLLTEWEKEWKHKFGGSEKDELETADTVGGGDDGGSDEDDDEDDEDGGRKRKKPKVVKPVKKPAPVRKEVVLPPPVIGPSGEIIVPEKRKRGRPRKVVPPPVIPIEHAPQAPVQVAPQQFLMATFALFSFFNSPITARYAAPSSTHSHTGTVLSAPIPLADGLHWSELVQVFHLVVSFLVFASIVLPWLPTPSLNNFTLWKLLKRTSSSAPRSVAPSSLSVSSALSSEVKGTASEAMGLRKSLGGGGFDIFRGVFGRKTSLEQISLEQQAWSRLADISVLNGDPSRWSRIDTFMHIRGQLSWFTANPTDLSTLALLIHPVGSIMKRHAGTLWKQARRNISGIHVRAHERLVLESLNVHEACQHLSNSEKVEPEMRLKSTPLAVIAGELVRKQLTDSLATLFVKTVLGDDSSDRADETLEAARRKTLDAAASLGGRLAELGEIVDKVWASGVKEIDSSFDWASSDEAYHDIVALLTALLLYRQIFPSSIVPSRQGSVSIMLSPPPSPGGKDVRMQHSLRKALGCKVFDEDANLEDARDRVVDVLFEFERKTRKAE